MLVMGDSAFWAITRVTPYGEDADLEQADLRHRQFYAPVVTDASSREKRIYGEKNVPSIDMRVLLFFVCE